MKNYIYVILHMNAFLNYRTEEINCIISGQTAKTWCLGVLRRHLILSDLVRLSCLARGSWWPGAIGLSVRCSYCDEAGKREVLRVNKKMVCGGSALRW